MCTYVIRLSHIIKLSRYQDITLSSYQAIKLSSYQAIKLSNYQAINYQAILAFKIKYKLLGPSLVYGPLWIPHNRSAIWIVWTGQDGDF